MTNQTIHIQDKGLHVRQLGERVELLQRAYADPAASEEYSELFKIIHFPGYTTPVQLRLILALVEAAEVNLQQAAMLRGALLEGSRAIIEESAQVSV
jgi:hypothetical protein